MSLRPLTELLLLAGIIAPWSSAWANICPDTSYEVESVEVVEADLGFECLNVTADSGDGCPERVVVYVTNACAQEITLLPWTGDVDGCASLRADCETPLPPDGAAEFEITSRRNDNGTVSEIALDGEVAFTIPGEFADGMSGEVHVLMNVVRRVYVDPPDEPPPEDDEDMGGDDGDPDIPDGDGDTDSGGTGGDNDMGGAGDDGDGVDGGTDKADADDGGCSTSPTTPDGTALALVLAGLALLRRRRRTS